LPEQAAHAAGLAGRYATALFELAEEERALDVVAGDLRNLQALLDKSADLRRLIRSPVLSREDQARALGALAQRAGFFKLTQKFLGFLAHKRRLFALPDVIKAYLAMLAQHKGEVAAELVSAVPLSEDQLTTIKKQISRTVGKTVDLATAVDPNLLGGLVLRVGSRMIDASVRTKLHRLELAMKGAT